MAEIFDIKNSEIIWQAPKQEQKTQCVPLITDYHGPKGEERVKAIAQSKRLQIVRDSLKKLQERRSLEPRQFNYST